MLVALVAIPLCLWSTPSAWWFERGVTNPEATPDDYAPVNQGQAKHLAWQAYLELQRRLPGGAGETLSGLVGEWSDTPTDDYVALNIGQVKNLAKPFYERLADFGYDGAPLSLGQVYPWDDNDSSPDDYALANIGQIKNLFSFDLSIFGPTVDIDDDGMADEWEMSYFGSLDEDAFGDFDGDGLTNLEEFALDTDPTRADSDEDGIDDPFDPSPWDFYNGVIPTITIVGDAQTGLPGEFNPEPCELLITNPSGEAFRNAPVYVYSITSGGRFAQSIEPGAVISSFMVFRTDQNGRVRFWYKHPPGAGVNSEFEIWVGNRGFVLTASSVLPDTDGDGIPDIFELGANYAGAPGTYPSSPTQFSSTGGRIPDAWIFRNGYSLAEGADTADPDDDGLDNYGEYLQGTDPNDPDSDKDGIPDGGNLVRRIMVRLPFEYGNAYADGAGAVFFSENGYWKRWKAGAIEQLGQITPTSSQTDAAGVTTTMADVHVFGANGDAVLGKKITRKWRETVSPYYRYENRTTELKNWLIGGHVRDITLPRFTGNTDFGIWDGHLRWDVSEMESASIDYYGNLWMVTPVGLAPYRIDDPRLGTMRIHGLVCMKPDGSTHPTPLSGYHSYRGVNRHGVYIGNVRAANYVDYDYYVGPAKVGYDPLWISDRGSVLALDVIHYADGTNAPTPVTLFPRPARIDAQDRLRGTSEGRPAVWQKNASSPVSYHRLFYSPVMLPDGWQTTHLIAPHETEVQLGQATKNNATTAFLLIPGGLRTDANRDGVISDLPSDTTSADRPFRFWSNDDNDELKTYTWGESVIPNFFPPGYISPGAIPLPVFYEQEQDDLAVTSATEDWKDDSPDCARDLEDFARLQVYIGGLHEAVRTGQIIVGVKWGSVTRANPSIRLHRHAESTGGTGYLFNTAAVTAQLNLSANEGIVQVVEGTNYLVSGTDVVRLPSRWFSTLSEQNPRLNLLFEGGQVGTGELRLVLLKKEGESYVEIGEGPGVWLDIKKPNEFVERFTCGDDHLGDVVAVYRHSSSATFAAPTKDEEKDYVLYVHGYNMAEFEKQRWVETTYKRLYWLGYKGRVGGFSWPCAQSAPQFDPSEEKAWQSAAQLKAHLANLKAQGYRVHVLAHSQGNVVMGEALRQAGAGSALVRTYIASQAAVAASCYKENVPLMPDPGQETPDVYGTYPPTSLPYFDGSAMSGATSRYVNFYNPVDYALTSASGNGFSWETDQRWKPTVPFLYLTGFQELTLLGFKTLTFPDDRFRIFSYAAEAKSKALGVMPTGGVFTSFTNLESNQQYGPEHIYHSGQFRASMATRYRYWQGVMTAADLTPFNPQ